MCAKPASGAQDVIDIWLEWGLYVGKFRRNVFGLYVRFAVRIGKANGTLNWTYLKTHQTIHTFFLSDQCIAYLNMVYV